MTKYSEISACASSYAAEFTNHIALCERLAHAMATKLTSYLEAPDDAVEVVALDENHETIWESTKSVRLRQGVDGFWYAAIKIKFQDGASYAYSHVALKTGFKVAGSQCMIKQGDTYTIDPKDDLSWKKLFDELSSNLLKHYSRSPAEPSAPMGFIANPKSAA